MRTNLDTDAADGSPADFLKMGFHVLTALFRVKHIVPLTVDRPFRALDGTRRTRFDAFAARAADGNRLDIGNIKRTVRENRSETDGRAKILMDKQRAFADGAKPRKRCGLFMGVPPVIVPAVFVDALGSGDRYIFVSRLLQKHSGFQKKRVDKRID